MYLTKSFQRTHWIFTHFKAKYLVVAAFALILGVTSLTFASPSYAASLDRTTITYTTPKMPLQDPRYNIRKFYSSIIGTVPLREGYPTGFGYEHIINDHGVYPDAAVNYVLDYGHLTSQSGTRNEIQGVYVGDNRNYLIIVDTQTIRQDGYWKGIITAYATN